MAKHKNFRSAIEELERELKPHIEDAKTKVEQETRKNPWAVIGVVALACFILGWVLSPRGGSRN